MNFEEFKNIIFNNQKVVISELQQQKIEESFQFLENFIQNKVIYGINTGFGPMAQYRIDDKDRIALQYNLIRSHASGSGDYFEPLMVKAAILCRLNTLSLGKSGVHLDVIELMKELVNRDITPIIFQHGGVGASGDLVQLAHLALVLIGEGEVIYKGERKSTREVYKLEHLKPLTVKIREGLSLMNGTSMMTGIAAINIAYAELLLDWSVKMSVAVNEIVQTYDDHFSEPLNQAKKHKGQRVIAQQMRNYIDGSKRTKRREEHLYTGNRTESFFTEKVQEYYSLRCVPQILGPVYDTIAFAKEVIQDEFNSISDNPLVDIETQQVYHGGNFHGDYVALEMDKLKIAVTKMSMLSERQINYLLNAKVNEILPPFLNMGKLGYNFGLQGVQFTAVSTTAENQTLSNPMYIHSIPNNNDNQDIVSMGTNAATITNRIIENTFEVMAIQAMAVVQAITILDIQNQVSTATLTWYNQIRKILPDMVDDKPLYPYVEQIKNLMKKM
ncbi:MAG: aromatic amino acid ammonia-lyase [Bacteroidota bacterium]|nr:aromatic amino acid ammonia-lyase [Bacteroidota bacterium]